MFPGCRGGGVIGRKPVLAGPDLVEPLKPGQQLYRSGENAAVLCLPQHAPLRVPLQSEPHLSLQDEVTVVSLSQRPAVQHILCGCPHARGRHPVGQGGLNTLLLLLVVLLLFVGHQLSYLLCCELHKMRWVPNREAFQEALSRHRNYFAHWYVCCHSPWSKCRCTFPGRRPRRALLLTCCRDSRCAPRLAFARLQPWSLPLRCISWRRNRFLACCPGYRCAKAAGRVKQS
mmetsp:Transcript_2393/g.7185  ORF Transcript_2393/g.7185 Transcript_2393/m.7185 type:complete len:230 (-) Transcript_2393:150-839(-)